MTTPTITEMNADIGNYIVWLSFGEEQFYKSKDRNILTDADYLWLMPVAKKAYAELQTMADDKKYKEWMSELHSSLDKIDDSFTKHVSVLHHSVYSAIKLIEELKGK